MTVSGLWSVLDGTGCGTPVGVTDLMTANNDMGGSGDKPVKSLAVDLSIWICEALTSSILCTFHADPALHLVYQRTLKLLKLGLKLIFVVEGKRRIRRRQDLLDSETNDSMSSSMNSKGLKNRRSGTDFWKACKSCENLLKLLGVPVIQATAEGEALCALLNRRGIVDGVISSDGDCFLFGAKVVYTQFSVENLERNQVLRFEASKLCAAVEPSDDEEDYFQNGDQQNRQSNRYLPVKGRVTRELVWLSREDLIAFAILTGSDLAGDGIPNVGAKKAIRFIHGCQKRVPSVLTDLRQKVALDEIRSWRDDVTDSTTNTLNSVDIEVEKISLAKSRNCTICLHPGDRRNHEKNGCALCGSNPGQCCMRVSNDEKFRRYLQSKAKACGMMKLFDLDDIIEAYLQPSDKLSCMSGAKDDKLSSFQMKYPDFNKLLQRETLIIKGQNIETSREYTMKSLPKLLARLQTIRCLDISCSRQPFLDTVNDVAIPIPIKIKKRLIHKTYPCYEVKWKINSDLGYAKTNNDYSQDYHFTTFEWQSVIEAVFPKIVSNFHDEEQRKIQELAEHNRQKMFIGESNLPEKRNHVAKTSGARRLYQNAPIRQGEKNRRKKARFFGIGHVRVISKDCSRHASKGKGADVRSLMRFVSHKAETKSNDYSSVEEYDSDEDESSFSEEECKSNLHQNKTSSLFRENSYDDTLPFEESSISEEECESYLHQNMASNLFRDNSFNKTLQFPKQSELMPLSCLERITCDMGMKIDVSPIVSVKRKIGLGMTSFPRY